MDLPLVFMTGPPGPGMGLTALDPTEWLWVDEHWALETEARRQLLGQRLGEVHAMLPGSEPAATEALAMVVDWLRREAPAKLDQARLDDPLPLRAAGQLVQEDLCVMERGADGAYRLTAAVLCFPAHWRLHEKLGRPVREIHAPVPGFAQRLAAPVERLLGGLSTLRPVWRANWSVVETPTLFHPQDRPRLTGLDAHNAGARLWLRVERQTLRRLPASAAVLFTIRTLIRRLDEVAAPAVAAAMAERLRAMGPGMAAYKGMHGLGDALLGWLDRRAAVGAQDDAALDR